MRFTASLRAGAAPPSVNYGSGLPVVGMHLNDTWGCCTCAANANIIEQQTYFGQHVETIVPDSDVLAAYEAVGYFNPDAGPSGSNPTDNGATVADALSYLKTVGMTGHKIASYGDVSVNAMDELKTAIWEFGGLSIGVNLPNSAIQQFDAGQPFTVEANDGGPAGGHCVYVCGYDSNGVTFWTWGKLWAMDYAFWDKYVMEAWVPVSQYWIDNATGKDPDGVDLVTLGVEFMAITGTNPFPAAPAPAPPSPVPPPLSPPAPDPSAPSSGCLSGLAQVIRRLRYGPPELGISRHVH